MTVKELFETLEYGPAPESAVAIQLWLNEHDRKFGCFINNQWVFPEGAETYPSINPASGEILAETIQAGQNEVDAAVSAARQAFQTWNQTPDVSRARHLYAIARQHSKTPAPVSGS